MTPATRSVDPPGTENDFTSLTALAARLDEAAASVRAQASILSGGLDLDWQGTAAHHFHSRVVGSAHDVLACAGMLSALAETARGMVTSARRNEAWLGWAFGGYAMGPASTP